MLDYFVNLLVDKNEDEKISIEEFRDFLLLVQPSHDTQIEDCHEVFNFYDIN
jgi:hypothetical protein